MVLIISRFVNVNYLNSRLTEAESLTELLPHERVRVVRLIKQSLQFA